jgi:uncharacterized protein (DUF1697 family)
MAWVVLLRATNVGGHRRFLPSELVTAKELAEFDLVNLGAAGTFVARSKSSENRLRRVILAHLSFQTDVSICPGEEILALLQGDPFGSLLPGTTAYLSVLVAEAVRTPRLPHYVPSESKWEMKLVAAHGRYVLSLYRRLSARLMYPNPIVEREFGVRATTRGWPTIRALGEILEGAPARGRATRPARAPIHGGK